MPRPRKGILNCRTCPKCLGPKSGTARMCQKCAPPRPGHTGIKGANHPAWKRGYQIDRDGYQRTYSPDHPWPRKGGYVLEHVRVMEISIGRRIERGEVVHHIDHDRTNNSIENLLLLTHSEHSRLHRADDSHRRGRDTLGRFAGGEQCPSR